MPIPGLPTRSTSTRPKKDKPSEARDKFVKQLLQRESGERQKTHDELLQLTMQINSLIRKEQKVLPAYQRRFKDEDPRSVFYYRMLRRVGLPEVHARFAPWFLKSHQLQLNRWSSVLFARLEQAFYARPEALSTLEVRIREHQRAYDAIMNQPRAAAASASPALPTIPAPAPLEPRQQNQLLFARAFRDCSFRPQGDRMRGQQSASTSAGRTQEEENALGKLEVIPPVPVESAPPGLAPQVRGQLESHGKHVFFTYNGRWKGGEMHGPMGVYAFSDGGRYAGEWERSKPSGSGTTVYPNGVTYTGAFADGKFHGFGVLEMPSRFRYEGEFRAGERCGRGTLRFLQTNAQYEGEFYANVRHGRGVETNALGYAYSGAWHENRVCGPGTLTCPDGSAVFKARWPLGVLGDAVRLVKREREQAALAHESWSRQLLRVRDDLRALDLQHAFWDAEDARLRGEEDARVDRLKKTRREKREAQAAAKHAFTEKAAAPADSEDDDDDGSSDEADGEDDDDDEDDDEEEAEDTGEESEADA